MKTVTVKKNKGLRQFSCKSNGEILENLKYILARTRPGDTITIYHESPPQPAIPIEEAMTVEPSKSVEIKEPVKVEEITPAKPTTLEMVEETVAESQEKRYLVESPESVEVKPVENSVVSADTEQPRPIAKVSRKPRKAKAKRK